MWNVVGQGAYVWAIALPRGNVAKIPKTFCDAECVLSMFASAVICLGAKHKDRPTAQDMCVDTPHTFLCAIVDGPLGGRANPIFLCVGVSTRHTPFTATMIPHKSIRNEMVRQPSLPISVVAAIVRDMMKALCGLAQHGIVHPDIKVGNVLLSRQHVWLTDCPISRFTRIANLITTASSRLLGTQNTQHRLIAQPFSQAAISYGLGLSFQAMLAWKDCYSQVFKNPLSDIGGEDDLSSQMCSAQYLQRVMHPYIHPPILDLCEEGWNPRVRHFVHMGGPMVPKVPLRDSEASVDALKDYECFTSGRGLHCKLPAREGILFVDKRILHPHLWKEGEISQGAWRTNPTSNGFLPDFGTLRVRFEHCADASRWNDAFRRFLEECTRPDHTTTLAGLRATPFVRMCSERGYDAGLVQQECETASKHTIERGEVTRASVGKNPKTQAGAGVGAGAGAASVGAGTPPKLPAWECGDITKLATSEDLTLWLGKAGQDTMRRPTRFSHFKFADLTQDKFGKTHKGVHSCVRVDGAFWHGGAFTSHMPRVPPSVQEQRTWEVLFDCMDRYLHEHAMWIMALRAWQRLRCTQRWQALRAKTNMCGIRWIVELAELVTTFTRERDNALDTLRRDIQNVYKSKTTREVWLTILEIVRALAFEHVHISDWSDDELADTSRWFPHGTCAGITAAFKRALCMRKGWHKDRRRV